LESISKRAARAAPHEINQSLGAILASADTAELILQAGGDRRKDLTRIVSRIRREVTIELRPIQFDCVVVGDPVQLQQVLVNLILNAMDAVAEMPPARRSVVLDVALDANTVSVSVRDRGLGIALENLTQMFESFFTTRQKGMGFGLLIARTIVEAHGGRIRAENGLVNGAVFRVDLPTIAVSNAAWMGTA
jgi:C4-dicarboxylate-specific signal transduction histidine kinase